MERPPSKKKKKPNDTDTVSNVEITPGNTSGGWIGSTSGSGNDSPSIQITPDPNKPQFLMTSPPPLSLSPTLAIRYDTILSDSEDDSNDETLRQVKGIPGTDKVFPKKSLRMMLKNPGEETFPNCEDKLAKVHIHWGLCSRGTTRWDKTVKSYVSSAHKYEPLVIDKINSKAVAQLAENRRQLLKGPITCTWSNLDSVPQNGSWGAVIMIPSTGCPTLIRDYLKKVATDSTSTSPFVWMKLSKESKEDKKNSVLVVVSVPTVELKTYEDEWGDDLKKLGIKLVGWKVQTDYGKPSGFGVSRLAAQKLAEKLLLQEDQMYTQQIDQNTISYSTDGMDEKKKERNAVIGLGTGTGHLKDLKKKEKRVSNTNKKQSTEGSNQDTKKPKKDSRPAEQCVLLMVGAHYYRVMVGSKEDVVLCSIYGSAKLAGGIQKAYLELPNSKNYGENSSTAYKEQCREERRLIHDLEGDNVLRVEIGPEQRSLLNKEPFSLLVKELFGDQWKPPLEEEIDLDCQTTCKLAMLFDKIRQVGKEKVWKCDCGDDKWVALEELDKQRKNKVCNDIRAKWKDEAGVYELVTLAGDQCLAKWLQSKSHTTTSSSTSTAKIIRGSGDDEGLTVEDVLFNVECASEMGLTLLEADGGKLEDEEVYQEWRGDTAVVKISGTYDSGDEGHAVCLARKLNDKGTYDVVIIEPLSESDSSKAELETLVKEIERQGDRVVGVTYTSLQDPKSSVCADISLIIGTQMCRAIPGNSAGIMDMCIAEIEKLRQEMYPVHPSVDDLDEKQSHVEDSKGGKDTGVGDGPQIMHGKKQSWMHLGRESKEHREEKQTKPTDPVSMSHGTEKEESGVVEAGFRM